MAHVGEGKSWKEVPPDPDLDPPKLRRVDGVHLEQLLEKPASHLSKDEQQLLHSYHAGIDLSKRCKSRMKLLKNAAVLLDSGARLGCILKVPFSYQEDFINAFHSVMLKNSEGAGKYYCHKRRESCITVPEGLLMLAIRNMHTQADCLVPAEVEFCEEDSKWKEPCVLLGNQSLHVKPAYNEGLLPGKDGASPQVRVVCEDFGSVTVGTWAAVKRSGTLFAHCAEIWDGREANFNAVSCSIRIKKDKDGNDLIPSGSGHWWLKQQHEPIEIEQLDKFLREYGPHLVLDNTFYNKYAAHPVIVPKPGGRGYRVCFNFKPLNRITEDDEDHHFSVQASLNTIQNANSSQLLT